MKRRAAKTWDEKKVLERIRKGYGKGELASYVPWIGVRDLASKGTSTRMWSFKTGRMMEFLSNIERDTFLIAEFRPDFIDYWEQFPLDRRNTGLAAERLRFRHPIYVGGRTPVVMTVDGVLTQRNGEGYKRQAIDCKHSSAADAKRTKEKLAIAKLTCVQLGLPHSIVTEKQVPRQVVKNILWVRSGVRKSGEREPVPGAFDIWPMRMHRDIQSHIANAGQNAMPLNTYCKSFESQHLLPRGLGLRCMKLLMWQHLVDFDLSSPAPERLPLSALKVTSAPMGARYQPMAA